MRWFVILNLLTPFIMILGFEIRDMTPEHIIDNIRLVLFVVLSIILVIILTYIEIRDRRHGKEIG